MMEIQRAMNQGKVEVTGNKFSFSNPARVILHKHDVLGGMQKGMPAREGLGI